MRAKKLSTQILSFFLICVGVLLLVQILIIGDQMTTLQTEQIDDLEIQLVQARADQMGENLQQYIRELRLLQQSEVFATNDLRGILEYLSLTNAYLYTNLYDAAKETFLFADASGIVYLFDGTTLDISQREFFLQAFATQKEYTISKPLISRVEWERVVIISYPLYREDGSRLGYLLANVPLKSMDESLSNIGIRNGVVWIMDSQGRILAEDDNHTHGDSESICPKSYNLTRIAKELQHQQSGMLEVDLRESDGELLTYASIPHTSDWNLCVLVSKTVAYAPLRSVILTTCLIWIVMVAAVSLVSLFYLRSVTRPIKHLASSMDAFDLQTPAPPLSEDTGSVEVRQLSASFNRMSAHIQQLLAQIVQEQNYRQEARFQVLQAQINPHFLYNTLDTISWKAIEKGNSEIADIISALSQFFRISLSKGRDFITLNDEVEHIFSYLFIQQIRYEEKLDYFLELDPSLNKCKVPKLILQPLVENAIYHGIKPTDHGSIYVRIRPDGEQIRIIVADSGVGIPPEKLQVLREQIASDDLHHPGIGLNNVAQRIRLTYGKKSSFRIYSKPGRGTVIRIIIPLERI